METATPPPPLTPPQNLAATLLDFTAPAPAPAPAASAGPPPLAMPPPPDTPAVMAVAAPAAAPEHVPRAKRAQRAQAASTRELRTALDTLAAPTAAAATAAARVSGAAYLADAIAAETTSLNSGGGGGGGRSGTASLAHSSVALGHAAHASAGQAGGGGGGGGAFGTQPAQLAVDELLALPIECLGSMEGVLVVEDKEIAALLQDEVVCSSMSLELAFRTELKRHRVRPEDVARVRAILVSAFRRHRSIVMLQVAPLEELDVLNSSAETFRAGDAVPRPGSKTWHLMRWLTLDEHVRCALARASTASTFGAARYSYYLVANATSFATSASSPTEAALREADEARAAQAEAERLLAATRAANAVLAAEAERHERTIGEGARANEELRARLSEIMRAHERLIDRCRVLEDEYGKRNELLRDIFLQHNAPGAGAGAAPAAAPAAGVVGVEAAH